MKNKESIEANFEESALTHASSEQPKKQLPESMRKFCWKKGQSGNPGGRPKRDYASELCQAVIEQNPDEVYKGILRTLMKGSAFALQVVSDRAYGKVKESIEVDINTSEDLVNRLRAGMKRLAK